MPTPAAQSNASRKPLTLPLIFEQDADGGFVVECPVLPGCYTQGDTYEEALKNIEEVIEMILEDEEGRVALDEYVPANISLHSITIAL